MTQDEVNEKVRLHRLWLQNDQEGQQLKIHHHNFTNIIFDEMMLAKAEFLSCFFINCSFKGTDFQEANVTACFFKNCILIQTNFSQAIGKATHFQSDLKEVDFCLANLKDAYFEDVLLDKVRLCQANLLWVDFRGATLKDVDFDYSAFPLWCGGSRFTADDKFVAQVLAHLCSLKVSPKAEEVLKKVRSFAKTADRAYELGLFEDEEDDK